MKQKLKYLRFAPLFLIFSGLFFYQNCGKLQPTELGSYELSSQNLRTTTSLQLREQHCASCHDGANASANPRFILDDQKLIEELWVRPGDPDGSPLFQALYANMPLGKSRLSDGEIRIFSDWIQGLAEDGTAPAHLQIDTMSILDFGSVATNAEKEVTLTVLNSGARSAMSLTGSVQAPFHFKGIGFPGAGGTCGPSLSPGGQCTLVIRFAPTAAGPSNSYLTISYQDREVRQALEVSLQGMGVGGSRAQLTLRPTTALEGLTPEEKVQAYPFGVVVAGASTIRSFTVHNSGAAPATGISITGLQSGFSVASQTCATSLAEGESCVIEIKFAPTAPGVKQGQMILNYNSGDGTSAETQGFIGSGTSIGREGSVFYSEIRTILSTSCGSCHNNPQNQDFLDYPHLLKFKKTGFFPAIDPGNQDSRMIERISQNSEIHPRMGAAPFGSLTEADRLKIISWINDGAPESDGRRAILQVTEGSVNFGSVVIGRSATRTLEVSNTGDREATSLTVSGLASPFSFKGGSFPGTGGTCTPTLSSGSQCTLILDFVPTIARDSTGTINVTAFNGSSMQTVSRDLTGKGTTPSAAVLVIREGANSDFGYVGVSRQSQVTIHIRNSGGTVANLTSMAGLSAPMYFKGNSYTASGNCGTTLAANAECNIVIEFKPTANGLTRKTLKVNYKSGNTTATKVTQIILAGRGAGAQKIYFTNLLQENTGALSKCVGCHTSMSTFAGVRAFKNETENTSALDQGLNSRFVDRLVNAKNGTSMAERAGLSNEQIQQILDWIAQGTPAYEEGKVTQSFKPLIGDRYYISSLLFRVFGSAAEVSNQMDSIISRADVFGSPCFTQDFDTTSTPRSFPVANDKCFSQNSTEIRRDASPSPVSSAIAESMRITTCMRIVAKDSNITSALQRAGVPVDSTFSDAQIQNVYERFYPGGVISTISSGKFKDIGSKAVNPITGLSGANKNLEGWRYIFMTLCLSPGWQAP